MPLLLFVVNDGAFFLRHRGLLARAAMDAGYEVHVATPPDESAAEITRAGFVHHSISLSRTSSHPIEEARTVLGLFRLFRAVRPDIVHLVTIKPVLYGGIAARLARVPAAVFAVSGLGYVFLSTGLIASVRRTLVWLAYRLALAHRNSRIIFQNADDAALFVRARAVRDDTAVVIPGNGIDLDEFCLAPLPNGDPVVVLPARMLRDKGIVEFVDAARRLRAEGSRARFVLAGSLNTENPASVSASDLERWQSEGTVEWWGHRGDMPAVYAKAHIVCLPSYREGIPRALIEAAAVGRPIVTTDVPGCRDVVRNGVTGYLVPPRDSERLALALKNLLEDAAARARMGAAARSLVLNDLSPASVIRKALDVYAAVDTRRIHGAEVASTSELA